MGDKFVMSSRQAAELDYAFARNGWNSEDVKDLSRGDVLAMHLGVLRGTHKIIEIEKPSADSLADFFKTREGLWVSPEFQNRILAPALAMGATAPATVGTPFNLPKEMNDFEIRKELGDGCIFEDPRAFCSYLARALERQWGGTDGDFLNNGCGTNFYVRGLNSEVSADRPSGEVFTVRVISNLEWLVRTYQLSGGSWSKGDRAFPCNS